MTPIKKQVSVRILIVVIFTCVCQSDKFLLVQATSYASVNETREDHEVLSRQSSHDDSILNTNKENFSYLNDTRSDDELIQALIDGYELKPTGLNRNGLSSSSNVTNVENNPFPPTRAPSNRLRSIGGYEAQEIAFKSPVSILWCLVYKIP